MLTKDLVGEVGAAPFLLFTYSHPLHRFENYPHLSHFEI
jgi:hypothetical protein